MEPDRNAAQLKHDIDSGKTGDKVDAFDPAAAPLGTDDEAAGTHPQSQPMKDQLPIKPEPGRSTNSSDHSTVLMYGAIVFGIAATLIGTIYLVR